MEFLRYFWTAAVKLDSSTQALDEANRFPICRPEPLQATFHTAGFVEIRVAPLRSWVVRGCIPIVEPFERS